MGPVCVIIIINIIMMLQLTEVVHSAILLLLSGWDREFSHMPGR